MKDRLKFLRKHFSLTQQEFADRIGIKRNTIANYEIGRNEPIDGIIFSICREFNVNEDWLRTGEGEMFKFIPVEDETAVYVSELLEDIECDVALYTLIKDIMKTYIKLDEKSKIVIDNFINNILDEHSNHQV